MFAFSILYLFALFATLLAEVVVRAAAPLINSLISSWIA
jgi:protoheme IX farnesyltransferase